MSLGWIKLHRKLVDNPIFKNDKLFRVFMYCLLKASHKEHDQLVGDSVVALKSGQLATGRKAISNATGLSEQNIKTAFSKLKALGILTIKPTNKYSIITIANWDLHQQDNQQVTNKQPASNQHVTTNNNVKNDKNENKDLVEALPQRSKFKFLADDYRCAEWIYSLVVKVATSTKKPNLESWANTIRMMRELDKLTYQDISDVFTWANKDSFWATNILSVTKLRKQFPQLQAKMKGATNGSNQTPSKKLSAYERARAVNDQYRQPESNECELVVGANDGHMGRAVDAGTGGVTIEHVGNGTFVDYE